MRPSEAENGLMVRFKPKLKAAFRQSAFGCAGTAIFLILLGVNFRWWS